MPNVKTIELSGTETAVRFGENYPYFWVRNYGSGDVYMSLSPDVAPDADGVIRIPARSGRSSGDFIGSGKIEITPQHNAVCPFFKPAGKGGDETNHLTTDNLVFSLSDIEFTTYNTKVLLGAPSIYNLPLGIIPKTAEIVSKCGTQSNFLFSYGNGGSGQTFALTQDEFVGWYNSVYYADMNEARGKVRHIVCSNENKSVTIYVNGQKVVNTELSYPCDPNDADFSLNSFHGQPSLNTSGSALYVLRFYRKRLSESEVINNFKIFSQKYKIEV